MTSRQIKRTYGAELRLWEEAFALFSPARISKLKTIFRFGGVDLIFLLRRNLFLLPLSSNNSLFLFTSFFLGVCSICTVTVKGMGCKALCSCASSWKDGNDILLSIGVTCDTLSLVFSRLYITSRQESERLEGRGSLCSAGFSTPNYEKERRCRVAGRPMSKSDSIFSVVENTNNWRATFL